AHLGHQPGCLRQPPQRGDHVVVLGPARPKAVLNRSAIDQHLPRSLATATISPLYGLSLPPDREARPGMLRTLGTGSTRRCAGTGSFPYGASAWRHGQLALGGPDR